MLPSPPAWRILPPRGLRFRVSCGKIAVLNRLDVAQAGEGVPVFHRMTLESLNVRLLKRRTIPLDAVEKVPDRPCPGPCRCHRHNDKLKSQGPDLLERQPRLEAGGGGIASHIE